MGIYVIGADTLVAKEAVADAGIDGILVQAKWDELQLSSGSELDETAVETLNQQISDALNLNLMVSFEFALHYAPDWVLSSIEPFTDHDGEPYISTDSGKNVRNWMWTALGRSYVLDFYTKIYTALTDINRKSISFIKFGGGYYGEIQYPIEIGSAPYRYWGGGETMQSGDGLAEGLSACPVSNYQPFTGTDDQDIQYINWYLGGIENWVAWQITQLKEVGFRCALFALHSGYSVRNNQGRSSDGWRQSFACGQDFTRVLGIYKNDPQVWPWSTWAGGADGWTPNTVDSDQASWKKLYTVAVARGKHELIGGENTGGESNSGMDHIFSEVLTGPPSTGPIYSDGRPQSEWSGFSELMWLNYNDLTAGGVKATLDHLSSLIND